MENQGNQFIHMMNRQGARNKFEKKHEKGKGLLKISKYFLIIHKNEVKFKNCYFCEKYGHFQKYCT